MTSRKDATGDRRNEPPPRRSGRHPGANHTELRFTNAAIDDLLGLQKKNRPALGWAMKKFLLIERDPEAGAPLGAGLHGYRKLTLSDRDWRIIWRVTFDDAGNLIIDIGEIWTVGARKDSEVYQEMRRRVVSLPKGPQTKTLEEVLALLEANLNKKRRAPQSKVSPDDAPAPQWLVNDLVNVAGYTREEVALLSERQAMSAWVAFRSRTE